MSTHAPQNLQETVVSLGQPMINRATSAAERYFSARSLLAIVFMLMNFTLAVRQIVDPDFWWHLRTGQYLVETRSVPHADVFSALFFGKEWIAHEWLSEVLIYGLYRLGGFAALIIAFALIITAAFALVYRRCNAVANHVYLAGGVVLLAAMATAPTWGVRPQMFSFLFAALFLTLLEDYQQERSSRSIWWLIPLMVLWVNMHAGFAAGIVLIVISIAGMVLDSVIYREVSFAACRKRVVPLAMVLVACLAAPLLNPSGFRIYTYPFETLTSQAMMKFIEEWRTPDFHKLMFQPLAFFILALLGGLALSRKRIGFVQLLLLLGTTWAMLRSGRNVPFFVLAATPLIVERWWDWINSQLSTRSSAVESTTGMKIVLNILLLIVVPVALVVVRVQRTVAAQDQVEAQYFPGAAVDYIRNHRLPQPLYNEYHWGGYLIWKLYPDYRVFIDGRADVYGDAYFEEFMSTHAGEPHWRESLANHNVRTVLITPDCALASLLREDHAWEKVFEDSQAVIFVRSEGALQNPER